VSCNVIMPMMMPLIEGHWAMLYLLPSLRLVLVLIVLIILPYSCLCHHSEKVFVTPFIRDCSSSEAISVQLGCIEFDRALAVVWSSMNVNDRSIFGSDWHDVMLTLVFWLLLYWRDCWLLVSNTNAWSSPKKLRK
jgi:hypothetical protein